MSWNFTSSRETGIESSSEANVLQGYRDPEELLRKVDKTDKDGVRLESGRNNSSSPSFCVC
jgi:hypothetical protein